MAGDERWCDAPTWWDRIKYGSSLVAGSLAGCVGDSGDSDDPGANNAATETETGTETGTEHTSYTVEMVPVDEVELDEPPERVTHYFPDVYSGELFDRGRGADIVSGDI